LWPLRVLPAPMT